ncbi:MAG: hypothetical protein AB1393_13980 [Candidatus Edwardsbacteria bacterium]
MFKMLLEPNEFLIYIILTNWVAIGGSLFLWLTCLFFGLIARRYEIVLRKRTDWQFMILAPSGILVYAVVQVVAFLSQVKMNPMQSWIAYSFFLLSGILSLVGALKFRQVIKPVKKPTPVPAATTS